VLETAPLAIMVLDTALQITQATNAAADMFSLSLPIANQHVSTCRLPDNFPMLASICSEALTLGEPITRSFSSARSQIKLTASPFFDMRGQMKGVTMVVARFPGLAAELEMVLSRSDIFLMNRAVDGTILRISESYAKALGMTRAEAEGSNYYDLVDDQTSSVAQAQDRQLLEGEEGRASSTITLISKATDQTIWVHEERFVFTDPSSPDPSIYSVGTDATELMTSGKVLAGAVTQ
jgi:two-component system CheB/CheR fusion protein